MIGDCTRELLEEIEEIKEKIKNFSKRVEGLSDDLILQEAEELVYDIKDMMEKKECVKDNLGL